MRRKILAALGAIALGAGLTFAAATAGLADESAPEAPPSTETSPPAPDPTEEPNDVSPVPGDDAAEPEPGTEEPVPDGEEPPADEEEPGEPEFVAAGRFSAMSVSVASTVQACSTPVTTSYVRTTSGMYFEDRAGGSHALTAAGLTIAWSHADLSLSKSAGYIPVDVPFESAGVPAMEYSNTSGASAGLNLTLWKNGAWFGNLVFEPLFAEYWINKAVPGMSAGPNPGYQLAYGTLDEFLQAFEANSWDVDIRAIGYSGGSGSVGSGVVTSLTVGCDRFVFQAATNSVCTATSSLVVTTLAALDLSSTRSNGFNQIVDDGLHVWTGTATGSPDPRKAAGYLDVPDFPLTQTGTVGLEWTGTSPPPGGQIVVDLDANGTPDGILVFEPSFYGQNLWLASIASGFDTSGAPSVGGGGGAINGSIDQYLARWPSAEGLAVGYSLGSGITGDGVLSLIEAGCLKISFDLPPATPSNTGGSAAPPVPRGAAASIADGPLETLADEPSDEDQEQEEESDDAPEPRETVAPTAGAAEDGSEDSTGGTVLLIFIGGLGVLGLAAVVYFVFIRPRAA